MHRKISCLTPVAIAIVAPVLLILTADPAFAYIGPGAGLSAIGAALALVGAIAFAIVGFLWYPAKRLMRRLRGERRADVGQSLADTPTPRRPPE